MNMETTPKKEESVASQIAKLKTEQEEAEGTFDGAKAGQIAKQIEALEAKMASASTPETNSVMGAVSVAKESGDPVQIATAEAAADNFYAVKHDAHVRAKEHHDYVEGVKADEEGRARDIERVDNKKMAEAEVSSLVSGQNSTGIVRNLITLFGTKGLGKSNEWVRYSDAFQTLADKLPQRSREAILSLSDNHNGLLSALVTDGNLARAQDGSERMKIRLENNKNSVREANKLLESVDIFI